MSAGRRFYKMSGSGNDFVVFDLRQGAPEAAVLTSPETIRALCARGTGVGADGVVCLEPSAVADFRMRYWNSDGSLASMCGNAALCTTRLAAELGAGAAGGMRFESDAGVVTARLAGGLPEVELDPVRDAEVRPDAGVEPGPGERQIGFAVAGVPHLVIRRDTLDGADVVGRGRPLRSHPAVMPQGANVNFVAPRGGGGWSIRTYERGVEGETLACGTGAISAAVLLTVWGAARGEVPLETRSGRQLAVRLERLADGWRPTLRGEGRVVFTGVLGEI